MLVDSSIWIEAAKPKSKESKTLKNLLLNPKEIIHTSKIIQLEVSQGSRTREQFSVIWDGFLGLEFLEVEETHWKFSALNFFKCKRSGISLSTIDCIIATIAQQHNVSLWTLDKIFSKVAPVLGIEVVKL